MRAKLIKAAFIAFLALAMAGIVALNHLASTRLRGQVAAQRSQNEKTARMQADNERLRSLVKLDETDKTAVRRAVADETERLRREIGQLEQNARESFEKISGQRVADVRTLQSGADPEQGLVRLEALKNSGRATPAAAAQTFVWAAFHGDSQILDGMFKIDDAARPRASAIVDGLSETDRARFPTAERIAGLVFGDAFTTATAVHIASVSSPDPTHAIVELRLPGNTQKVPLQLGPDGWQIVLNAGFVGRLEGWVKARTQGEGTPNAERPTPNAQ